MINDFQFVPLHSNIFEGLKTLSDDELLARHARWMVVDESPGYPCRVSLQDAKVGERVLFMPYWHHDVDSAYRAMGTILVREFAQTASPAVNEVPQMLHHRMLSVRAYDAENMMVGHDMAQGTDLQTRLHQQFENPAVSYIHLHYASPGCFSCAVQRV
ncbi:DUF1203 domain-containing protein [Aestuariibacter halophilus]|uniref:DUF1203 domain-containing protein n=1 Tax=Fluctibacter halophilus TaxID=226011 RepID=A0ABS8G8D8_9ALTE|nr:DUF1203 domain-containing protein [Aestuariibacter halophilus]MCC2616783.1 DUF1203 domain-containing protein [Aestuariibacter halophilus]